MVHDAVAGEYEKEYEKDYEKGTVCDRAPGFSNTSPTRKRRKSIPRLRVGLVLHDRAQ